ncbi:guanine deaminase [Alteromonas sp. H39]|uniref:guanine deaminase n=1 Tax=Alteromonas sp. H39 TaxID=3389876 RepID=UPI0039E0C57D
MQKQLFRASVAHFPEATNSPQTDIVVFHDGALVVEGEKIIAIGDYHQLITEHSEASVQDHKGKWLLPGLVDSHLHYPQTEVMGRFGEQLLNWLENYTFPAEEKFSHPPYAQSMAKLFLGECLKNGTTTGLVFSTVHKDATDTLFRTASAINMALVAGKVCMDRNCPPALQDTAESARQDSVELISRWHNNGRNRYALTPRFAPTSTEAQMAALAEVASDHPDVFIQTHLSENLDEIDWVLSLYPDCKGYLDVYEKYNMVRPRAVFGHCIHMRDDEWSRMAETGATVAFCPSSNLFLGSGLFDLDAARHHGVKVALATDVGAGTSFNMLKTYGEAYKVCQLKHSPFPPLDGLYMMTQGAAVAHQLEEDIGNLNPGSYADFVLLEPRFSDLTALRLQNTESLQDVLFAMSILGDERAVEQTWIAGRCRYHKDKGVLF